MQVLVKYKPEKPFAYVLVTVQYSKSQSKKLRIKGEILECKESGVAMLPVKKMP